MAEREGILTFLNTTRSKEELRTALSVIEEFKASESEAEWFGIMFSAWAKLEQLEDFLRLLTGEGADQVTDQIALDYFAALSEPEQTPDFRP